MFPVYADCFSRRTQKSAIEHINMLSFRKHIVAGELRSGSQAFSSYLRACISLVSRGGLDCLDY